jgi:hypothetical protein
MRTALLAVLLVAAGCGSNKVNHGNGGGGGSGGTGGSGGSGGIGGGTGGVAQPCIVANRDVDNDGDGVTANAGDCNDCDPHINPSAIELPNDSLDNDCNGSTDEGLEACDAAATGKKDAKSLTQSIELCDQRFVLGEEMVTTNGASDERARNVLAKLGVLRPKQGANFAFLSSGIAVDESDSAFVNPQEGTDLGNSAPNPLPNLAGSSSCGIGGKVKTANDYTELTIHLKAPSNVASFSFQFQYFSGEFPTFVCSMFNDQFLAIVKSTKTYPADTNLSFDAMQNPITVNSGFFTVCDKPPTLPWPVPPPKPQTQRCVHPASDNEGTGYELSSDGLTVPGGSTGWLTTTAPIEPGEELTLRFVIFDAGDGVLDSSALIDNFQWGAAPVTGPSTGPISWAPSTRPAGSGGRNLMCHG